MRWFVVGHCLVTAACGPKAPPSAAAAPAVVPEPESGATPSRYDALEPLPSAAGLPVPPDVTATEVERPDLPPIDVLPDDFEHGGSEREASDIDMVVLHTIGGPACVDGEIQFGDPGRDAVFWRDWFTTQGGKSIHYIIGRDGDIAQQRPELRTAGHVSFGGVKPNVNKRSIGIELINRGNGEDPFPEPQLLATIALLQDITSRRQLDRSAVWAHSDLDTRMQDPPCEDHPRNVDPGAAFPMQRIKAALTAPE
ncbi:MAG: N-acetylmuramoyl-L-alanine amidase [Myxococcales bacterium]|nr:N-acetylmuramoyl-L-alanine amidase [Myxococcales bacterium]